jgi:hypothetical protein
MRLARGDNLVQISRFLGRHSAEFTMSTYVHLLTGDGAPARWPPKGRRLRWRSKNWEHPPP